MKGRAACPLNVSGVKDFVFASSKALIGLPCGWGAGAGYCGGIVAGRVGAVTDLRSGGARGFAVVVEGKDSAKGGVRIAVGVGGVR